MCSLTIILYCNKCQVGFGGQLTIFVTIHLPVHLNICVQPYLHRHTHTHNSAHKGNNPQPHQITADTHSPKSPSDTILENIFFIGADLGLKQSRNLADQGCVCVCKTVLVRYNLYTTHSPLKVYNIL